MLNWLTGEVARIRGFRVRRSHGVGVFVVIALVLLAFAIGVFAGHFHYPYKTLPRPPLPSTQTVPDCSKENPVQHIPGACLPHPKVEGVASITATTQGPDLSNNDPIYGLNHWQVLAGKNAFVIVKLNEGTGFVDSTAGTMIVLGRAVGLPMGGYDFLHVCGSDARSEAIIFAHLVLAYHLLYAFADAEYGGGGCNARAWMTTWYQTVQAIVHFLPGTYTGAWWWQPHLGAWWYGGSSGGTIAWISGYGVRYPYMPSGRSKLDMWQFADHGCNGVTCVDLSVWRDGAQAFTSYTQSKAVVVSCCREGDRGKDVWLETHRLAVAGWLSHSGTFYSHHVALVVAAYQRQHSLHPVTGVTGPKTWNAIRVSAYRCRKFHKKDRSRPL